MRLFPPVPTILILVAQYHSGANLDATSYLRVDWNASEPIPYVVERREHKPGLPPDPKIQVD